MTTLTGVSLKKRRVAALQWSRWRSAGEPEEVTAARAYELSGVQWYADRDPRLKIRLTAVAIEYAKKGGRR